MTTPRNSRRDPSKALERRVQSALTTIYDPATPHIDLFNMGMIYHVAIEDGGKVRIDLAFSSPGHPGNLLLPKRVADAIRELEGVTECKVRIVNDPPWTLDRVSDHARVNMIVVGNTS